MEINHVSTIPIVKKVRGEKIKNAPPGAPLVALSFTMQ
jgi:hypothetical protein